MPFSGCFAVKKKKKKKERDFTQNRVNLRVSSGPNGVRKPSAGGGMALGQAEMVGLHELEVLPAMSARLPLRTGVGLLDELLQPQGI